MSLKPFHLLSNAPFKLGLCQRHDFDVVVLTDTLVGEELKSQEESTATTTSANYELKFKPLTF